MKETSVTIQNINGIHCRPSSAIVKEAVQFQSELKAVAKSGEANLKSMIEIITLALHHNDNVSIVANGPDEDHALQKMIQMFTQVYDYPDK